MIAALSDLTDNQFSLAWEAQRFPVILRMAAAKTAAHGLERKGWGNFENGASGEVIFRINQAGLDLLGPYIRAFDNSRAADPLPAAADDCGEVVATDASPPFFDDRL